MPFPTPSSSKSETKKGPPPPVLHSPTRRSKKRSEPKKSKPSGVLHTLGMEKGAHFLSSRVFHWRSTSSMRASAPSPPVSSPSSGSFSFSSSSSRPLRSVSSRRRRWCPTRLRLRRAPLLLLVTILLCLLALGMMTNREERGGGWNGLGDLLFASRSPSGGNTSSSLPSPLRFSRTKQHPPASLLPEGQPLPVHPAEPSPSFRGQKEEEEKNDTDLPTSTMPLRHSVQEGLSLVYHMLWNAWGWYAPEYALFPGSGRHSGSGGGMTFWPSWLTPFSSADGGAAFGAPSASPPPHDARTTTTSSSSRPLSPPPPVSVITPSSSSTSRRKAGLYTTNYASNLLGSAVLSAPSTCQSVGDILSKSKDVYMLCPCEAPQKEIVIQLIRDVAIQQLMLQNAEHFSSGVREFRLLGSRTYPTKSWVLLGRFETANHRGKQFFHQFQPHWPVRFVKLQWISSHGTEPWCTLTSLAVYGVDALETLTSNYAEEEEEEEEVGVRGGEKEATGTTERPPLSHSIPEEKAPPVNSKKRKQDEKKDLDPTLPSHASSTFSHSRRETEERRKRKKDLPTPQPPPRHVGRQREEKTGEGSTPTTDERDVSQRRPMRSSTSNRKPAEVSSNHHHNNDDDAEASGEMKGHSALSPYDDLEDRFVHEFPPHDDEDEDDDDEEEEEDALSRFIAKTRHTRNASTRVWEEKEGKKGGRRTTTPPPPPRRRRMPLTSWGHLPPFTCPSPPRLFFFSSPPLRDEMTEEEVKMLRRSMMGEEEEMNDHRDEGVRWRMGGSSSGEEWEKMAWTVQDWVSLLKDHSEWEQLLSPMIPPTPSGTDDPPYATLLPEEARGKEVDDTASGSPSLPTKTILPHKKRKQTKTKKGAPKAGEEEAAAVQEDPCGDDETAVEGAEKKMGRPVACVPHTDHPKAHQTNAATVRDAAAHPPASSPRAIFSSSCPTTASTFCPFSSLPLSSCPFWWISSAPLSNASEVKKEDEEEENKTIIEVAGGVRRKMTKDDEEDEDTRGCWWRKACTTTTEDDTEAALDECRFLKNEKEREASEACEEAYRQQLHVAQQRRPASSFYIACPASFAAYRFGKEDTEEEKEEEDDEAYTRQCRRPPSIPSSSSSFAILPPKTVFSYLSSREAFAAAAAKHTPQKEKEKKEVEKTERKEDGGGTPPTTSPPNKSEMLPFSHGTPPTEEDHQDRIRVEEAMKEEEEAPWIDFPFPASSPYEELDDDDLDADAVCTHEEVKDGHNEASQTTPRYFAEDWKRGGGWLVRLPPPSSSSSRNERGSPRYATSVYLPQTLREHPPTIDGDGAPLQWGRDAGEEMRYLEDACLSGTCWWIPRYDCRARKEVPQPQSTDGPLLGGDDVPHDASTPTTSSLVPLENEEEEEEGEEREKSHAVVLLPPSSLPSDPSSEEEEANASTRHRPPASSSSSSKPPPLIAALRQLVQQQQPYRSVSVKDWKAIEKQEASNREELEKTNLLLQELLRHFRILHRSHTRERRQRKAMELQWRAMQTQQAQFWIEEKKRQAVLQRELEERTRQHHEWEAALQNGNRRHRLWGGGGQGGWSLWHVLGTFLWWGGGGGQETETVRTAPTSHRPVDVGDVEVGGTAAVLLLLWWWLVDVGCWLGSIASATAVAAVVWRAVSSSSSPSFFSWLGHLIRSLPLPFRATLSREEKTNRPQEKTPLRIAVGGEKRGGGGGPREESRRVSSNPLRSFFSSPTFDQGHPSLRSLPLMEHDEDHRPPDDEEDARKAEKEAEAAHLPILPTIPDAKECHPDGGESTSLPSPDGALPNGGTHRSPPSSVVLLPRAEEAAAHGDVSPSNRPHGHADGSSPPLTFPSSPSLETDGRELAGERAASGIPPPPPSWLAEAADPHPSGRPLDAILTSKEEEEESCRPRGPLSPSSSSVIVEDEDLPRLHSPPTTPHTKKEEEEEAKKGTAVPITGSTMRVSSPTKTDGTHDMEEKEEEKDEEDEEEERQRRSFSPVSAGNVVPIMSMPETWRAEDDPHASCGSPTATMVLHMLRLSKSDGFREEEIENPERKT